MPARKHSPKRTCIVCRTELDKRDLIRLVRTPDQSIIIDETGKLAGRGAYLCHQPACWQKGLSKPRLKHVLKMETPPTDENMAVLQAYAAKLRTP
jgi:predicted RNA-binding protein YlxR (DUF448 family)